MITASTPTQVEMIKRVPDRLERLFVGEDFKISAECEAGVTPQAGAKNRAQREQHEENKKKRRADPNRKGRIFES